ncbi:DNA repair protein RecO [Paramagnetospirillum kuznetsovii]|uniref:DNA repair protein RecO n=1 Tax=Paramagnetospirillum kuznetsovii TaxID=2053833 RepID=A0A364NZI2_9PROT|nr:DNA repair protein RecO [Paramagnetospirillum kuznetsovii]RAU22484.1 DNA repair protein RecO [Paramagnetospirillum kuznetsovii]
MEWDDEAIVLAVRRHGEHGGIASLLTRAHGRHAGLLHGAQSKANRAVAQPGNQVRAWWKGRLAEQLGTLRLEVLHAHAGMVLDDPARLTALSSACALAELALPERQPHPGAYAALSALLGALAAESWPSVYVHWELALLRDLGFGLDLSACAVTGATEDLGFVSPKTGRAVSRSAAGPWKDRLLPLPRFLVDGGEGEAAEIRDGLSLSGYFLDRHVLAAHHAVMPAARIRLVDRFRA